MADNVNPEVVNPEEETHPVRAMVLGIVGVSTSAFGTIFALITLIAGLAWVLGFQGLTQAKPEEREAYYYAFLIAIIVYGIVALIFGIAGIITSKKGLAYADRCEGDNRAKAGHITGSIGFPLSIVAMALGVLAATATIIAATLIYLG
jgi:hypothetical protein